MAKKGVHKGMHVGLRAVGQRAKREAKRRVATKPAVRKGEGKRARVSVCELQVAALREVNSSFLVQCDACERVATSRSASVSLAMSRMDLGLVRAHHYHRARQRIPRRLSLHPWCLSLLPS